MLIPGYYRAIDQLAFFLFKYFFLNFKHVSLRLLAFGVSNNFIIGLARRLSVHMNLIQRI